MDSTDAHVRKRVCKACDRCRLKKSKCDGASPCSRCKADNAICVFGERKKAHDKVYPKGYVEMLEQQQSQLVAGLRELYRRLQQGEGWPGMPLKDSTAGHPLTHDILERLDLLQPTSDSGTNYDGFEEDCSRMQRRLLNNGSGLSHRRGSVSSDSDHGHLSSPSSYGTPNTRSSIDSSRNGTPPTPPMDSPFPVQAQLESSRTFKTESMPPYMRTSANPTAMQWMQPSWASQTPIMNDMSTLPVGLGFTDGFDSPMASGYEPPPMQYDQFAVSGTMNPSSLTMADFETNELDFSNYLNTVST